MARALIIANQHGFHSDEISTTKKTLERSGHIVKIASIARSAAVSSDGVSFYPDFAIYEVNPDYFDAVVIVGESADELARRGDIVLLVRSIALKDKVVGGITMGPLVLAAAGVLSGKRATIKAGERAVRGLRECNAKYDRDHVVCDGNVITADDPESAEEFVKEIIKILS